MLEQALRGLASVAEEFAAGRPTDVAMQRVTDLAIDTLQADHASVRVCDHSARLRSLARSGIGASGPAPEFRKGQGLLGWAVQTGKLVRVPDCPIDARFEPTPGRGFEVRSVMSIPLVAGERILGVFSVSAAKPSVFGELHEQVGVVMAHCVGQALRTAELSRLATTDALTRAYNRSQLLPSLESEMNRSAREHKPLSVLLMDLDNFKLVNDEHGHAVGDAVLSAFAEIVRRCVRSFDRLVRRGGEEFELIMPGTTADEGLRVAERIRERLCSEKIRIRSDLAIQQTVSIGLATWDGGETASSLDQRADRAMYEAKRRGRNRVVRTAAEAQPSSGAQSLRVPMSSSR